MFALFNRKIVKVASVEKLFRYSFCWNFTLYGVVIHITTKHIKIKENNYYCSKTIFFSWRQKIFVKAIWRLNTYNPQKRSNKKKIKEKKNKATLLTICVAYSGVIAEELLENSVPTRPYIYYYIISYHTF